MYSRVSKYLDVSAHARRLINTSTVPSVFTLYVVLNVEWGALLYLSIFSGLKTNQYDSQKDEK